MTSTSSVNDANFGSHMSSVHLITFYVSYFVKLTVENGDVGVVVSWLLDEEGVFGDGVFESGEVTVVEFVDGVGHAVLVGLLRVETN
tara:strand:+ start:524 stop:784 length:261 start_codon:yes stop_codon:yes gene_type:complete